MFWGEESPARQSGVESRSFSWFWVIDEQASPPRVSAWGLNGLHGTTPDSKLKNRFFWTIVVFWIRSSYKEFSSQVTVSGGKYQHLSLCGRIYKTSRKWPSPMEWWVFFLVCHSESWTVYSQPLNNSGLNSACSLSQGYFSITNPTVLCNLRLVESSEVEELQTRRVLHCTQINTWVVRGSCKQRGKATGFSGRLLPKKWAAFRAGKMSQLFNACLVSMGMGFIIYAMACWIHWGNSWNSKPVQEFLIISALVRKILDNFRLCRERFPYIIILFTLPRDILLTTCTRIW